MPRSVWRIFEKSIGANIDIWSVKSSSIVGRSVFMMTLYRDLYNNDATLHRGINGITLSYLQCGRPVAGTSFLYVTIHLGQLSLAVPPWVGGYRWRIKGVFLSISLFFFDSSLPYSSPSLNFSFYHLLPLLFISLWSCKASYGVWENIVSSPNDV